MTANQVGCLHGDAENGFQIGARDVEFNRPPAADVAAEQGRLGDEAKGSWFAEGGLADDRDQFRDAGWLGAFSAEKGLRAQGDEKEIVYFRRAAGFRFRPGLRNP